MLVGQIFEFREAREVKEMNERGCCTVAKMWRAKVSVWFWTFWGVGWLSIQACKVREG